MNDSSALRPTFISFGADYDDFRFRFIFDDYSFQSRDYAGPVNPKAYDFSMRSIFAQASYDVHATKALTLTPMISFKSQSPYALADPTAPMFFDITVRTILARLAALGVEALSDRGHARGGRATGEEKIGQRAETEDVGARGARARILAELGGLVDRLRLGSGL